MVVGEGDGTINVPVTLSAPGQNTVTFHYAESNGTAVNGTDYQYTSGDLVSLPATTPQSIPIHILERSDHRQRSFWVSLSASGNAPLNASLHGAGRSSPSQQPNGGGDAGVVCRNATVDASAGTASVPVLMGGPTGQASNSTVTVDYTTANGSATGAHRLHNHQRHPDLQPGRHGAQHRGAADRPVPEPTDHQLQHRVVEPDQRTIGGRDRRRHHRRPRRQPGRQPAVSVGSGHGGRRSRRLDRRSRHAVRTRTVHGDLPLRRVERHRRGGPDYQYTSNDRVFAPGETTKTIRIELVNDLTAEPRSRSGVRPRRTNSTIARASTRVNHRQRHVVATPALYVRDATVDASAGTVTVPVLLGGPPARPRPAPSRSHYATADGTAVAGHRLHRHQQHAHLQPRRDREERVVPSTCRARRPPNPPAASRSTCDSPTNATIAVATGTVTIGAHGATAVAQPAISSGPDLVVGEGDGYVDIPVTLSTPGSGVVTVNYSTADNTAGANCGTAANGDYLPFGGCTWSPGGTLTFAPGETTKTIRIELIDDLTVEPRNRSWSTSQPSPATSASSPGRRRGCHDHRQRQPGGHPGAVRAQRHHHRRLRRHRHRPRAAGRPAGQASTNGDRRITRPPTAPPRPAPTTRPPAAP